MLAVYLRKYRSMILCSLFFFYLGCGLSLSLLRLDCVESTKTSDARNDKIEYAVVILSKERNWEERETIRKTWMRLANNIYVENGKKVYKWNQSNELKIPNFIKFYFVVGGNDMDEHSVMRLVSEGDNTVGDDILILEDAKEGYNNLSHKILATMKWLKTNLKNLKYVIKCDDDSFVRIDLIIKNLEEYAPKMDDLDLAEYVSYKNEPVTSGLYWGYFNGRAQVAMSGKWEEEDWFLCDHYLPYALGGGYVISKNIVDYIGLNSGFLKPYKSEDVSMGVWTAALSGIRRVHDVRFDTMWRSRGCLNDMLIRHKQNTTDMTQMYKNLMLSKGINLCSLNHRSYKTYRYNWNILPSGCCS